MESTHELQELCEQAASRSETWMLGHLKSTDVASEEVADPVAYYKWPLTLIVRKNKRQARKLFRTIVSRCLDENGDLVSQRSGFHSDFHHYANAWLVMAALELDEKESIDLMVPHLASCQNPITGGAATKPKDGEPSTEDPLTTAFLGMVACATGRKDAAQNAVHYLKACCNRQSGDGFFWLRSFDDGQTVRKIPEGADSRTYVLELGAEEQGYYFLGAVCLFLYRYVKTFGENEEVSFLIGRMLAILGNIEESSLGTIWAAKVAPGAVALYSITQNERFLGIARPVIRAVLSGQTEHGYWLKDGKPWMTVSAEQCYWLTEIRDLLQK